MKTKKSNWSRREILSLGSKAGTFLMCGPLFSFTKDPLEDIDHIIWAVSDLDEGIAYIEERTGVKAIVGGVHRFFLPEVILLLLRHLLRHVVRALPRGCIGCIFLRRKRF